MGYVLKGSVLVKLVILVLIVPSLWVVISHIVAQLNATEMVFVYLVNVFVILVGKDMHVKPHSRWNVQVIVMERVYVDTANVFVIRVPRVSIVGLLLIVHLIVVYTVSAWPGVAFAPMNLAERSVMWRWRIHSLVLIVT
jgi:hypothetical protein